ncbi:hypothetical protein CJ430_31495, partial [Klebsiella pneumoniae]
GPTEVTADFRFTRVMAEQAARARLTLDDGSAVSSSPALTGPTEVTADFRFTRVMAEQAARARLTLDDGSAV